MERGAVRVCPQRCRRDIRSVGRDPVGQASSLPECRQVDQADRMSAPRRRPRPSGPRPPGGGWQRDGTIQQRLARIDQGASDFTSHRRSAPGGHCLAAARPLQNAQAGKGTRFPSLARRATGAASSSGPRRRGLPAGNFGGSCAPDPVYPESNIGGNLWTRGTVVGGRDHGQISSRRQGGFQAYRQAESVAVRRRPVGHRVVRGSQQPAEIPPSPLGMVGGTVGCWR